MIEIGEWARVVRVENGLQVPGKLPAGCAFEGADFEFRDGEQWGRLRWSRPSDANIPETLVGRAVDRELDGPETKSPPTTLSD